MTTINLGTGTGYSALEIITAFEKLSVRPIPYQIKDRRLRDIVSGYYKVDNAFSDFQWKTWR